MALRRAVILSVLFALMVMLSGCWVFSVYPLASSEDDLVFDKLLAGNWWNQQNRCTVSFSRFPDERAYRVVYITGIGASENCWLEKGSSASFHGTVVELGGERFLDVVPADMPMQNHMILTHSLVKLKVDLNTLTLTPMNYNFVEGLMAQEKLRGVPRSDNVMVLAANTNELREFIRQNATSDNLWDTARKLEFQRRFDAQ